MKRYLYLICMIAAGVILSCSKGSAPSVDDLPVETTLTLELQDQSESSRATVPLRYIVEVYDRNTPLNVFANGTHRMEQDTPVFKIRLSPKQQYYVRCWVDRGGADVYDTDMQDGYVTLKDGKNPVEAWVGLNTIGGSGVGADALSLSLQHAVAKIQLKEKSVLGAGTVITMKYNQPTRFELSSSTSDQPKPCIQTIELKSNVAGSESNPVLINVDDQVYVLAPTYSSGSLVMDISMELSTEPDGVIEVTNVPFNANYITNIVGKYSSSQLGLFNFTYDEGWSNPDHVFPPAPKLGNYYYDDGTFSTDYNSSKNCKGVVFWIDPLDNTKAKAVSVNSMGESGSEEGKYWYNKTGTPTLVGASSESDGLLNMAAIKAAGLENHWAARDCDQYVAGQKWYLPALKEVTDQLLPEIGMVNMKLMYVIGSTQLGTGDVYYLTSTETSATHATSVGSVNPENGTHSLVNADKIGGPPINMTQTRAIIQL